MKNRNLESGKLGLDGGLSPDEREGEEEAEEEAEEEEGPGCSVRNHTLELGVTRTLCPDSCRGPTGSLQLFLLPTACTSGRHKQGGNDNVCFRPLELCPMEPRRQECGPICGEGPRVPGLHGDSRVGLG